MTDIIAVRVALHGRRAFKEGEDVTEHGKNTNRQEYQRSLRPTGRKKDRGGYKWTGEVFTCQLVSRSGDTKGGQKRLGDGNADLVC